MSEEVYLVVDVTNGMNEVVAETDRVGKAHVIIDALKEHLPSNNFEMNVKAPDAPVEIKTVKECRIQRSFLSSAGSFDAVNELLAQGWSIVDKSVVNGGGAGFGWVEYLFERNVVNEDITPI